MQRGEEPDEEKTKESVADDRRVELADAEPVGCTGIFPDSLRRGRVLFRA